MTEQLTAEHYYQAYHDAVARLEVIAARSKMVDGETARIRARLKTHGEPESQTFRGGLLRRYDKEQGALDREAEAIAKTIEECRAVCPELPEPFVERMSAKCRAFSGRLSSKRLERGRLLTLMESQKGVAREARAARIKELDGEIEYYERLLRDLDAQEAAAEGDDE